MSVASRRLLGLTRSQGNGSYAQVIAPGLLRTKTRADAPSRPRLRTIQTKRARIVPAGACLGTSTNSIASILNATTVTVALDGTADDKFFYYGSVAWQLGGSGWGSLDPHSATYNPPWVFEFCTDAPIFALEMTNGAQNLQILVNDEEAKAPTVAVAGGSFWVFDWNGSRVARKYTLRGQGGMAIKTLRKNAIDSLWAPCYDNVVRVGWLGDSYSQVVGSNGISSIPMMAMDMLGWKAAISAEGGSGYDQPNPATTVARYADRVADLPTNCDIIALAGGHNIRDTSTEAAAVALTIANVQARFPGKPILVFGPFYGSIPGESGYTTEESVLQTAVANAGANVTYVSTAGWITGTGRQGNRVVTDGATTSGSPTLTSATAAFVSTDQGVNITGAGIPANTTILAVVNATTVTLSANATATATGVSVTITNQHNDGNADILIDSGGIHPVVGIGSDYFAARCAEAVVNTAAI